MVTIGSLLLPILLAAVLVFIVSSVVWMVLPYHKSDYRALPDEEAVFAALGEGLPAGQYDFPHMTSMEDMKKPEIQERFRVGPVGYVTIAAGAPNMPKLLGLWFLYLLLVGFMVAYVSSRTLPAGTPYLDVFQITGTVAWLAYGFSSIGDGIWFSRPWSSVGKALFDALLYGMVTAGAFAWLWPV
ncbi:MAG: hypothetical protein R3266_06960 [Gemmatimonadota bacterium]|nr:hypothetical protein [Gemmatimonadota bacterium]